MLIDLNKEIFDIDGSGLINCRMMNIILSNVIKNSVIKGDVSYLWDIAKILHKEGVINLTDFDLKALNNFIENNEALTVLAKGQIQKEIQKQMDAVK